MILNNLHDNALLDLYLEQNNKEAIAVLYKRYSNLVFGLCFKYLKDEHTSKDLVADIFIRVMENVKAKKPENFSAWLFAVSKNHIFSLLRKVNVKFEEISKDSEVYFMENEPEMSHYIKDINEEQLKIAIDNLNEEQKICINLFYLQQKSYQEVVQQTGYDIKKVKSCIQNGKRNLKLFLNQKKFSHE